MLSRTADHLYWMARYTERAENTVRMLDVSYRMSLLPRNNGCHDDGWGAILAISELTEAFARTGRPLTPRDVIEFVVLDRNNLSSVWNCLRAARENAHAVRGTLTAEMWETTNATWLEIRDMTPEKLQATDLGEFFEWVKFRSHLLRGVTFGTMLHDDAFQFVRLGTFLERADNTARLLDVKYHSLLPQNESPTSTTDYYQWGALLRSVSAFETYRHVYRDVITPYKVAELLILNDAMPRSLHSCVDAVNDILGQIANLHSAEAARQAGELHATLHYGRMDDIFDTGLHPWLERFLERINRLGDRIGDNFLVPVAA
ncbi:Alpha-E domain-containing protein [Thauera humireducens]|uniref:alpha-E domain-containing protein n=1 Tax=Thauera humireducens TaxID=1134435 RepID=UPI002467AA98|nr:alpha-E domain-containing protein [Thauera humireducens]CAH1746695.1 Alpha-E domain-containing protein [Thauera humireducens]